ncbi:Coiled-coil domain-containing protein 96 [Irineochytrium annulatum]|nr:Coiled-coil domain-containing protein 96 [Irineochytrium annulatum]
MSAEESTPAATTPEQPAPLKSSRTGSKASLTNLANSRSQSLKNVTTASRTGSSTSLKAGEPSPPASAEAVVKAESKTDLAVTGEAAAPPDSATTEAPVTPATPLEATEGLSSPETAPAAGSSEASPQGTAGGEPNPELGEEAVAVAEGTGESAPATSGDGAVVAELGAEGVQEGEHLAEGEEGVVAAPPEGDIPEAINSVGEDGMTDEQRAEQKDLTSMNDSVDTMMTSLEQAAKDEEDNMIGEEIMEEIEIIPAVKRTLTSPLPNEEQGFTFMNIDYEEDPDLPVMMLATRLSRSESAASELPGGAAATAATPVPRVRTPILKASTPTLIEPENTENSTDEKDTADATSEKDVQDGSNGVDLDEGIDREVLILGIRIALDFRDKHRARNTFLQNKLGEYFRRKRADENHDGEKSVTDQEQRYANCMAALQDLRAEFESLNSTNQKIVNEYKVRLEERILEAESKAAEFVKYKRGVALGAENSRTGKPLPVKIVDQLEATELRKEADVVAVRLDNIKLRNKLRRHEQLLRQKEELADGLHLIDFEQLKIENQTYNEKIEERNEELLKLRKKITNIVQVLTHVKEKLQFVQVGANIPMCANMS